MGSSDTPRLNAYINGPFSAAHDPFSIKHETAEPNQSETAAVFNAALLDQEKAGLSTAAASRCDGPRARRRLSSSQVHQGWMVSLLLLLPPLLVVAAVGQDVSLVLLWMPTLNNSLPGLCLWDICQSLAR